jgi:hypothetical protein
MESKNSLRGVSAGLIKNMRSLLTAALLALPLAASAYWEYYDDGYYVYSYWVEEYDYGSSGSYYDDYYSAPYTSEDPWANLNGSFYGDPYE